MDSSNQQRRFYEGLVAPLDRHVFMEGFNAAVEFFRDQIEGEWGEMETAPELFQQWLKETTPIELCTCKNICYKHLVTVLPDAKLAEIPRCKKDEGLERLAEDINAS